MECKIAVLSEAVEQSSMELGSKRVLEAIRAVVPTYKDPNAVNERASESMEMKKVETA